MTNLIDGYWMRIGAFCLAAGIDNDQVRRAAQRGHIEATLDERGHLLIAAKEVARVRRDLAEERARLSAASAMAQATVQTPLGNGSMTAVSPEEAAKTFRTVIGGARS